MGSRECPASIVNYFVNTIGGSQCGQPVLGNKFPEMLPFFDIEHFIHGAAQDFDGSI